MFRLIVLVGLALVGAGFSVEPAEAAKATKTAKGEKWVKLASREIVLSLEKDKFDLSKAEGSYKALRFETKKSGIELKRYSVQFAGAGPAEESKPAKLSKNAKSKPIEFGDERFLDSAEVGFAPDKDPKRTVTLEAWGLQSSAGKTATRPVDPKVANARTEVPPGTVTAGGDVLFGAQDVGFGRDRDQIKVGGEIGKFDKVRLRVIENDIFINSIKVLYLDGTEDSFAIDQEVKQSSRTDWIKIKGDRFIKSIELVYRSKPSFKGQARVEVFGEYAAGWLGPNGEGRKYNEGWVLLGSQTAGFIGFDNDIMSVGQNEGGFKRLRVAVKDRAITLNEIKVFYVNGKDEVFTIKSAVAGGTTYGPLELKNGREPIKEIRGTYRSRFIDGSALGKGNAIVEVWAQH